MKQKGWPKKFLRAAALVFCMVLVCLTIPQTETFRASGTQISDATTKAYEDQIAKIVAQQRDLERQIAALKNDKNDAVAEKEKFDQLIGLTNDKIEAVEKLIGQLKNNIAEKGDAIAAKEEQLAEQYSKLLDRIRVSYERDDASLLEMLLDARSLGDFLAYSERITSILNYDKRLITQYETDKTELEEQKASLEADRDAQLSREAELEADKASLALQLADSQAYINQLAADQSRLQKLYNEYAEQEDALNTELENYIKEQLALLNSDYVGGDLRWPLPLANNYITSQFGWRTYDWYGSKVTDYHRGIDIRASTGTNIYAANDGEVMISTYHSSYGYYVLIDHGGGKSTLYAHSSKLLVKAGDKVKQGDVIALVGTTGNSNGPHLHFEVRIDGVSKNPLDYVTQP